MNEQDWGTVLNYMEQIGVVMESIPKEFTSLNSDILSDILRKTVEFSQDAWVLQSYLLCHAVESSPKKGKNKVITTLAEAVGISRSTAYDLVKINKNILSQDFEIVKLPFLTLSHFKTMIVLEKELEAKKLDPIKLLKRASEEKLNAVDLENEIKGIKKAETVVKWYEVKECKEAPTNKDWQVETRLNTNAEKFISEDGITYIKIRERK